MCAAQMRRSEANQGRSAHNLALPAVVPCLSPPPRDLSGALHCAASTGSLPRRCRRLCSIAVLDCLPDKFASCVHFRCSSLHVVGGTEANASATPQWIQALGYRVPDN